MVEYMSGKSKTTSGRRPLVFGDIEAQKRKGFNQSQIAGAHGVSRQAVSWQVRNYGGARTQRQIVGDAWPWKTSHAHSTAKPFQNLRNHGEFMATGGKGMSEDKLQRLRSWWKKLEKDNVVLEFDPDLPPEKGVSPVGGFAYRPRTPADGDLLIRVNEHTNLTEHGKLIWRRPRQTVIP